MDMDTGMALPGHDPPPFPRQVAPDDQRSGEGADPAQPEMSARERAIRMPIATNAPPVMFAIAMPRFARGEFMGDARSSGRGPFERRPYPKCEFVRGQARFRCHRRGRVEKE